jgi:hypothetical protein
MTVYNLHASILAQKSPIFWDMFSLPLTANPQGLNEHNAILLEGITCEEFDDLLQWIYKM